MIASSRFYVKCLNDNLPYVTYSLVSSEIYFIVQDCYIYHNYDWLHSGFG